MRIRSIGFGLLSAAVVSASLAGAQPADTGRISTKPFFTKRDAYIVGAFSVGSVLAFPLDHYFARRLQTKRIQEITFARRQAKFFNIMAQPGALIISTSLYAIGRIGGDRRTADLGLHGTEAVLIGSAYTFLLKGVAGRARPELNVEKPKDFKLFRGFRGDTRYRSYPSGHATTAFAAAAVVTAEAIKWDQHNRWIIGAPMYGAATMVALSRMYDNKHWASDVITGAGIGTFIGHKIVRYNHSHPGNRVDKWLLTASLSGDGIRLGILPTGR